jgi:hypothetical protein
LSLFGNDGAGNISETTFYPAPSGAGTPFGYSTSRMTWPPYNPSTGQVLYAQSSDGTGSLSNVQLGWASFPVPTSVVNGSSNVIVAANGNVTTSVAGTANILTATGTGVIVSGTGNITGNIIGANIATAGCLSVGGNVIANANLTVNCNATVIGNLQVCGNVTFICSNAIVTNDLFIELANNQSTFANINGAGLQIGNTGTTGLVNWTYSCAANALSTNVGISAGGNITGGNIKTACCVSATGNITANFFIGNGSQLTGLPAGTQVVNGNSNIVVNANGNVTTSVCGNANILVVTGTGLCVTGTTNVCGNANVGNLGVCCISASGNITGAGILTSGCISATSNVTGGNVATGGAISATGNTSTLTLTTRNGDSNPVNSNPQIIMGYAGSTDYPQFIHTRHNAGAAQYNTIELWTSDGTQNGVFPGNAVLGLTVNGGRVGAGNVPNPGNVLDVGGNLWANGNITANYFIGNGSQLTGLPSGTSLVNGNSNVVVAANGNVTTSVCGAANVLLVTCTGANITGTANISGNANVGSLGTNTAVITTGNITTVNTGLVQNGSSNIVITANANVSISSAGNPNILVVTGTGANINGNLTMNNNNVIFATTGKGIVIQGSNANVTNLSNSFISIVAPNNSAFVSNYTLTLPTTAGTNGQFLRTDGTGNLSWSLSGTQSIIASGSSNVSVTANANVNISSAGNANIFTVTGTGVVTSGNITASGVNKIFTADFTSANVSNRLNFVTSNTNSNTGIYALPGGTATAASWQATNNSDPTNASKILIATNGTTDTQLVSGRNGTGTFLPLSLLTNGTVQAQVAANGQFTTFGNLLANTNLTVIGTANTGDITSANITASGFVQTANLTTGANTTAGTITGTWTLSAGSTLSATYADLGERYRSDSNYEPGTVVAIGGTSEVTIATQDTATAIAGVVSTEPAYILNSMAQDSVIVALAGRVPTRVVGTINKGDILTISNIAGVATATSQPQYGTIIGRALESYNSEIVGSIEIKVDRG